ncbi:MAG: DNA polymerase III subunit delta [Proteobacteria bacterium]|jgi:DNA polymerase III subunit delta|nr:MAG: DNA polymerase III subunit delta [Pseudomonadota bacterium]
MVALKNSEFDAFLARGKQPIALVFGPDSGLVRERVDALINRAVDDRDDPFAVARLEGDSLAETPDRLVEEAHTFPLFGGRRAVWVRAGARNFAAAVEKLIAAPPASDCQVVIEAGDLARSAPLRTLCERAGVVAAIPCYPDAERDLGRVIDEEMRESGLSITPDARALLVSSLGGDRLATRSELRKLALYARGSGRVDVDDVLAVVADAAELAFEGIADAAFAGQTRDVEQQFAKARAAAMPASVIIGTALRYAAQLHRARLDVEAGTSPSEVLRGMRVNFRRDKLVETALRGWTSLRLEQAMALLAEAALETRRRTDLGDAVASRALLAIAMRSRTKN